MTKVLVAIPVYNEEKYLDRVMGRVLEQSPDVLIIDDGSTDRTPCLLPSYPVEVIRHRTNRGYGRSLLDAFRWAGVDGYDWIITMDCDEQHEPEAIPDFMELIEGNEWDVISGSRYLRPVAADDAPPPNRAAINRRITAELNDRLGGKGLRITDAFCGFKAYRVSAVRDMQFDEHGYAFPMQFWVQSVALGHRICEIPVKLIYNDPDRTFGGPLNDDAVRYDHYRSVLHNELHRHAAILGSKATADLHRGACCS
jgi:glycosyltransferase involved in cell wall biosynthesis